jgi:threonine dehydrogenase-like Zn-dependent dehydrogenase
MTNMMRAVAIRPGEAKSAHPTEMPRPVCQTGEYLVRILEVGIDGTDREPDSGEYGEGPPGEDLLVIGHEAFGVVVDECRGVEYDREGDLVVPTVRRPCPERCLNCRNGEYDFCTTGNYRERGIKGLHGYLAEYAGVLDRNGVACLLGVTGGERRVEIPSDDLNNRLVLGNRRAEDGD